MSAGGTGRHLGRRQLLAAIAGTLACPPVSRAAQRPDPVIGILYAGSFAAITNGSRKAFWRGLAESGYEWGRNVEIEIRQAHNDLGRLPDLARDLVHRQVSVIFVSGSWPAVRAAKAATTTIPIVFANSGDPVRLGLVAGLNRPGANVTGVSDLGSALSAKRLELAKLLVPSASRIALLLVRSSVAFEGELAAAREGAAALSLETFESPVRDAQEIEAAFAAFAQDRADAVCLIPSALLFDRREQVAALAARCRLPAVYPSVEFLQSGGLMSYGTSLAERSYQAGICTGLILNGADPAELPVHRLAQFELGINMRVARALGLAVPARFLALADRVIE